VYADLDGNGIINPANEIIEENNYYPFGLKHEGYNEVVNSNRSEEAEAYKLNGKEYEDSFGLNIYEMDLRQLDPAIGRWVVQDPVVHHDYSPYSAFDNNPVYWSDPSGADSQKNVTIADLFNKAKSGVTSFEFENGQLVGESFTKSIETSLEQTYLFLDAPTEGGGGGSGNGGGNGNPQKKFVPNNNLIGTTAQSFLSSSIVFEGLSDSQLEYFRVIPEAAENNNHTIIPKNGVKYKTDGLYMKDWSESNYWFKIGDGRYVTVTYENGMYKAKDSSVWVNSIALQLLSAFNFKSINEPHWVNNPFNSK